MLTERFCQDVFEEYFGRQQGIGRRNDNPTVFQFGCNDNIFRMQRLVINFTGIQEVNIKIKEQPHEMMLTTSFFQKEKRNNYTLATYINIRR